MSYRMSECEVVFWGEESRVQISERWQMHLSVMTWSWTVFFSVPPHTPNCHIPSSALTGSTVVLRCQDQYSIPPAVYTWYKDKKQLKLTHHANATYMINRDTGILVRPSYQETFGNLEDAFIRLMRPFHGGNNNPTKQKPTK